MTTKIATANRLTDGAVVYSTPTGDWSEFIEDGEIVTDEAAVESLLIGAEASVADRLIIGPYLIDMITDDGALRPRRKREEIRAAGPSIATLPERKAERKMVRRAERRAERREQYVRV